MHVVQCPHCQRKFRVGRAVSNARMKCSRCGESFTGSSTEVPEASAAPAAPAPAAGRPRRHLPPPSRGAYGPVVIIVCAVALAGVLVLAGVFVWIRTHPRRIVKVMTHDVPAGSAQAPARLPGGSGRRTMWRPGDAPGTTGDATPGGAPPTSGPATGLEAVGDPMLSVGEPAFATASTGGMDRYACGEVHSRYATAIASVTVEARAGEQILDRQTFAYLPAGASIRYSLRVPTAVSREDLAIVARRGGAVEAGLVVWDVPQDRVNAENREDGSVCWDGRTRNPAGAPVKDVKIYLDFYSADGVHGGTATGGLRVGETIGVNKTGLFRVNTDALAAPDAQIWVTRVVARKY